MTVYVSPIKDLNAQSDRIMHATHDIYTCVLPKGVLMDDCKEHYVCIVNRQEVQHFFTDNDLSESTIIIRRGVLLLLLLSCC